MSIAELLEPYMKLPPLLAGDPTHQLGEAMKKSNTLKERADELAIIRDQYTDILKFVEERHAEEMGNLDDLFREKRSEIFGAGVEYGVAKGTEKANELAKENYRSGMNKGHIDAFSYMIGGPKYALLDRSGETVKWYTGETMAEILGSPDDPNSLRNQNHRTNYFDPKAKWFIDLKDLNRTAPLSQDPGARQSQMAFGEYKELLYLDMGILRKKVKNGTLKGRVLEALDPRISVIMDDNWVSTNNIKGTTSVGKNSHLLDFMLNSKRLGPSDLVSKITKGNTLPTDLNLLGDDVKQWSAAGLLEYNKHAK